MHWPYDAKQINRRTLQQTFPVLVNHGYSAVYVYSDNTMQINGDHLNYRNFILVQNG